jgi:hypothetical protein
MPGIPLQLAVGHSPLLKSPQARNAIVRLPEDSLPEESNGDEQQGCAQQRDQELGRDLGWKSAYGTDE